MSVETKIGPYTLGNLKTFRGHEGETCFQGNILLNGKKIATWSEDSWGGPMGFQFKTSAEQKAFIEAANQHPIAVDFAREMRETYGKSEGDSDHADLVVSTIAQEMDLTKRQEAQIKRWCKTKIVFRMPGDKEGEYRSISRVYNPASDRDLMAKKFPGCEIINDRFCN